jgi:DNA-binding transcriptional LysR family regulator
VRKLTGYSLGLYAPSSRPEWHDAAAGNLQLTDVPIVGYIPDFIYAPELRYLDEIEAGLEATIRCSSINAQREIIAGGAGIGVLPCFMADNDQRLTRVRQDITIQRSFWLSVHRDVANQPRVRTFIDWLDKMISEQSATRLIMGQ